MPLLNSRLAARSCVIKRFVLPGALLRNFPLEGSLSRPPNLKRPRMDTAPFTSSFITILPRGTLSGFIFNLVSRQELTHQKKIKCWLYVAAKLCVQEKKVSVCFTLGHEKKKFKFKLYWSDKSGEYEDCKLKATKIN